MTSIGRWVAEEDVIVREWVRGRARDDDDKRGSGESKPGRVYVDRMGQDPRNMSKTSILVTGGDWNNMT